MLDLSLLSDLHDPKWFVLFVRSNQEKMVSQRLTEREVEHFLPCYPSVRQWKDRRVTLDMPLFPGYIFVRLPFVDRVKVLTVPNIVSLVGNKNSPSVVSQEEINWIKCGLEHGKAMPHTYLAAGERIKVIAGPLRGMQGILLKRQNGARVVVCLDSITRSFVVEVELDSIKPLAPLLDDYREAV
ncbi:MAG TPA: UpxY family transcription antiterminator [Candidatus Angelobacter sp.]